MKRDPRARTRADDRELANAAQLGELVPATSRRRSTLAWHPTRTYPLMSRPSVWRMTLQLQRATVERWWRRIISRLRRRDTDPTE